MRTNDVSVWLVGFRRGETCALVADCLHSRAATIHVARPQLNAGITPKEAGDITPDLILVYESTPDEFTAADVERLLTSFPLTRILCISGDWCESAGRTRSVWPIALRMPVAQAIARLEQELEVIAGGRGPLAVTATREEAFAPQYGVEGRVEPKSDSGDGQTGNLPHGVMLSPDREYRRMLTEWWVAKKSNAVTRDRLPRVVLWDADPLPVDRRDWVLAVESLRRAESADAVVALVGFPREDDCRSLLQAGVAAVVPKLAPLATLQACLLSMPQLGRAFQDQPVAG